MLKTLVRGLKQLPEQMMHAVRCIDLRAHVAGKLRAFLRMPGGIVQLCRKIVAVGIKHGGTRFPESGDEISLRSTSTKPPEAKPLIGLRL